jgi:hypothetical protein
MQAASSTKLAMEIQEAFIAKYHPNVQKPYSSLG